MNERIFIEAPMNYVLLYEGKAGVTKDEILKFCDESVVPFLKSDGINRAQFWITEPGKSILLVVLQDTYNSDWSKKIGGIDKVFNVDSDPQTETGNLLKIERQDNVRVP